MARGKCPILASKSISIALEPSWPGGSFLLPTKGANGINPGCLGDASYGVKTPWHRCRQGCKYITCQPIGTTNGKVYREISAAPRRNRS